MCRRLWELTSCASTYFPMVGLPSSPRLALEVRNGRLKASKGLEGDGSCRRLRSFTIPIPVAQQLMPRIAGFDRDGMVWQRKSEVG